MAQDYYAKSNREHSASRNRAREFTKGYATGGTADYDSRKSWRYEPNSAKISEPMGSPSVEYGKMNHNLGVSERNPNPDSQERRDNLNRLESRPYAKGGKVHTDAKQDRKLINKVLDEKGYARGGKAGKTNINIVIAPQEKLAGPAMPPPMPPPMPMPKPPMAPPPGMGPPGMKRGGKITAGAESGVGRLQKAKSIKKG